MSSHSHGHVSRVDAPCLFHGTLGVSIAIVMQMMGVFRAGDDRLMAVLLKPVFHGQTPEGVSLLVQVMVCAVFCYGSAFVVLDTVGVWRRVVIGVSVFVLIVAMVPTLSVWSIYFSPFLTIVGVFWTWFFTLMYASHHVMPCEVVHVHQATGKAQIARPVVSPEPAKKVEVVPDAIADENKKYQPQEVATKRVKEKLNG